MTARTAGKGKAAGRMRVDHAAHPGLKIELRLLKPTVIHIRGERREFKPGKITDLGEAMLIRQFASQDAYEEPSD